MTTFDLIVVGTGTVGASVCLHAARRGARVLGLDPFGPPHARGSHHGGSRIIRRCYFEHPDYVPLLIEADRGWDELQAGWREPVVHRPGVLYLGAPGSDVVERSWEAGRAHGLPCERLDGPALAARFPRFRVPPGWSGLFEPTAGFVRPERAVAAYLAAARDAGARLEGGARVRGWEETSGWVVVRTDDDAFEARALVLAAGPFTGPLAPSLGVPLRPVRVVIAWADEAPAAAAGGPPDPVWYVDRPGQAGVYGIPSAPDQDPPLGAKVALHGAWSDTDPEAGAAPATAAEADAVLAAAREFVPWLGERATARATCLYTLSPDGHFVVDRLPGARRAWVACGLSGHGFKFAPVLGRALAECALDGGTALPIGFLSRARLAPPAR